jgi:hypothetical protein
MNADDSSPDGHPSAARTRKNAPETGSFGKSTRRSRSKTATPARKEDPTILAADAIFSNYLSSQPAQPVEPPQRKSSMSASMSQTNLAQIAPSSTQDVTSGQPSRYVHQEPTEVILRGFVPSFQYAAIDRYERIAGRICEDYPRDEPHENRRFKSDLKDPTSMRQRPLTAEEKAKALRYAGGEHWIKVTFESAEAAEAAVYSSPQIIHGHMVFAELYRGIPPASDEAIPADTRNSLSRHVRKGSQPQSAFSSFGSNQRSSFSRPQSTPALSRYSRDQYSSLSPPESNDSSNTLDTATLSATSTTLSSGTVVAGSSNGLQTSQSSFHIDDTAAANSIYCRKIPTARRAILQPAESALLPQPSYSQRLLSNIPFMKGWGTEIIGSEVPRLDNGEFDWVKASLYWRLWWWLDATFGLCNGDLAGGIDKDD